MFSAYEYWLSKNDQSCVTGLVEHHLSKQPEESDVVHDLLAFLAEEMIRLNKEKRAAQNAIDTARVARRLGFRAFFFVTAKTFKDEAKELIRSYQQELANDMNTHRPYTIVVLDKQTLFEGEPLPKEVPQ